MVRGAVVVRVVVGVVVGGVGAGVVVRVVVGVVVGGVGVFAVECWVGCGVWSYEITVKFVT